jgi:acyl-CoA thioesterase
MPTMTSDHLALARERTTKNWFWRFLGVEVADAHEGWVRLRLPLRDELRNAPGAPVHGGVYSALVDMAVGGALGTMHEHAAGGTGQATLDLNVSYIGAAAGETIFVEGKILRRGRSVAFGEATVTDGDGKLVAVGRATYLILAPRPPTSAARGG